MFSHQHNLIQLVDLDQCWSQCGWVMLGSCWNIYIWHIFLLFVSVYIVQLLQVTIEFLTPWRWKFKYHQMSYCIMSTYVLDVRIDAAIFHNQEGGWIGFNKSCPVLALWNCFDNNLCFWINWNGIVWCLMYGAFVL